jgi:hypothetical protein
MQIRQMKMGGGYLASYLNNYSFIMRLIVLFYYMEPLLFLRTAKCIICKKGGGVYLIIFQGLKFFLLVCLSDCEPECGYCSK